MTEIDTQPQVRSVHSLSNSVFLTVLYCFDSLAVVKIPIFILCPDFYMAIVLGNVKYNRIQLN